MNPWDNHVVVEAAGFVYTHHVCLLPPRCEQIVFRKFIYI